jgi:zinc transport system substrate-binding protein
MAPALTDAYDHSAHDSAAHGDEAHADEHGHAHAGRNPHIWLSPRLVKLQARAMEAALAGLYPEKREAFAANRARFDEEVDALDAHIRQQTGGLSRRAILAYHPSWDYFARDYGLTALSIESAGREPGPAEMAALLRKARQLQVRVVFTEPELSARAANIVARELDAKVESASPLAYEWEANLRRFTELLVRYGR